MDQAPENEIDPPLVTYLKRLVTAMAVVMIAGFVVLILTLVIRLMGWIVFHESIDPYVLLGGGMIIAAISYMTIREAQLRRRITPAPNQAKI